MRTEFTAVQEKLSLAVRDYPDNEIAVQRLNRAIMDAQGIEDPSLEEAEIMVLCGKVGVVMIEMIQIHMQVEMRKAGLN
jgi:hypothetical protein